MLSGCVPEKGRRPLPSPTLSGTFQAQEPLPGGGEQCQQLAAPKPPPHEGARRARAGCCELFCGPSACPAVTRTHPLSQCALVNSHRNKDTATKPDTDGPSYHHTAPRGHMTGQPLGLSLSLSYTHRSVLACASTDKHVHIRLPHTDDTRCCERPRERLTGQGTEGEGGSP